MKEDEDLRHSRIDYWAWRIVSKLAAKRRPGRDAELFDIVTVESKTAGDPRGHGVAKRRVSEDKEHDGKDEPNHRNALHVSK